MQAGNNCTVETLAKMSNTSRRTVFRDLKELQAIGVPYKFDPKEQTYTVDPEFSLPPINLSLQEALSLLLLAVLKIKNNLPVKIRQYCNKSLKKVTVKPPAQAPMNLFDKTFAAVKNMIEINQNI
jgi:predicted DNA-binding transcriptional regulator YafY